MNSAEISTIFGVQNWLFYSTEANFGLNYSSSRQTFNWAMDQSKKRERDEAQPKQRKRKSRFGEAPAGAVDQAAAAAQAAQAAAAALAQQRALQAAQMQAQIQAQIASVKSMLDEKGIKSLSAQSGAPVPLVLDERGRQVDKFGRVVKTVGPERTFKINAKTATTAKPKVNPYLAHKTGGGLGIDTSGGRDAKPAVAVKRSRANKALQFIEPGKYIKQAENMRDKEMKKLLLDDFRNGTGEGPAKEDEEKIVLTRPRIPPTALIDVPEMEWWDEALLPATIRKARKTILEGAARPAADHAHIAATNVKTHTLVHHPVSVRPTSDKAEPTAIPLMLTKKVSCKYSCGTRCTPQSDTGAQAHSKAKACRARAGEARECYVRACSPARAKGEDFKLDACAGQRGGRRPFGRGKEGSKRNGEATEKPRHAKLGKVCICGIRNW